MSYSKSGFLWNDYSTMNVFTVATYAFTQKNGKYSCQICDQACSCT